MTVFQNGLDSVQVSWTPPSGEPAVTGYIIYYQQQDGGHTNSKKLKAKKAATTATITGLIQGATYSITMVATSSTLPSDKTRPETITIPIGIQDLVLKDVGGCAKTIEMRKHLCSKAGDDGM